MYLEMNYWLMKTEPDEFSISDLKQNKTSGWEGVRNYQARNFMRDEMKKGDLILIYHSSCAVPGVAGLATVCKETHTDPSAFDKQSPYHDPKSDPDKPRWFMVEVKFKGMFQEALPLSTIKEKKQLAEMKLVQKGNRLSIMPVHKKEFDYILKLANYKLK